MPTTIQSSFTFAQWEAAFAHPEETGNPHSTQIADIPLLQDTLDGLSGGLAANVNYYVNDSGDDATGDGTELNPFQTIEHILTLVPKNLGGNQFSIFINGVFTTNTSEFTGFYNGNILIASTTMDEMVVPSIGFVFDSCACNIGLNDLKARFGTFGENIAIFSNCSGFIDISTFWGGKTTGSTFQATAFRIMRCDNVNFGTAYPLDTELTDYGFEISNSTVFNAESLNAFGAFTSLSQGSNTFISLESANGFLYSPGVAPTQDYQYANKKYVDDTIETKLTVDLEYYVSNSGDDINGRGDSDSPFATLDRAFSQVPLNLNGHSLSVKVWLPYHFSTMVDMPKFHNGTVTIDIFGSGEITYSGVLVLRCENVYAKVNIYNLPIRIEHNYSTAIAINNCYGVFEIYGLGFGTDGVAVGTREISTANSPFVYIASCYDIDSNKIEDLVYGFGSTIYDSGGNVCGVNSFSGVCFVHDNVIGFIRSPEIAPVYDYDYANKKYVDDNSPDAKLTSNLVFYISDSGDDNNDGSELAPFRNLQKAFDLIPNNLNSFSVEMYISGNNYTSLSAATLSNKYNGYIAIYKNDAGLTTVEDYSFLNINNCNCTIWISGIDGRLTLDGSRLISADNIQGQLSLNTIKMGDLGNVGTTGIQLANCPNVLFENCEDLDTEKVEIGLIYQACNVAGLDVLSWGDTFIQASYGTLTSQLNSYQYSPFNTVPTQDYQYANKKYVDDLVSSIVPPSVQKYTSALTGTSGTILASTHGCGTDVIVQIYESGSVIIADISVNVSGDVSWSVNTALVSGKIVII